jgi:hypothetical protein
MITEPTLPIVHKGRDLITVQNCLHLMLASTNDWVVPAGMHERRFVVQKVADSQMQKPEWFKPLYAELERGGYGAMLYDLLKVDIGDWHPRTIIRTEALAKQQLQSLSPLDQWWLEALHTGVLVGALQYEPHRAVSHDYEEDVEERDGYRGTRKRRVRRRGLLDAARASSTQLRSASDHVIGDFLKEKGAVRDKPKQRRGWRFPPLSECRDKWVESYPATEWDDQGFADWQAGPDNSDD